MNCYKLKTTCTCFMAHCWFIYLLCSYCKILLRNIEINSIHFQLWCNTTVAITALSLQYSPPPLDVANNFIPNTKESVDLLWQSTITTLCLKWRGINLFFFFLAETSFIPLKKGVNILDDALIGLGWLLTSYSYK